MPASSPKSWASGPVPATEKALKNAGLGIGDIGLFEINEAFAVQVLSFLDHFGIADDDPRVNRYGGAIAVGHPLASSGVRLMNQLARQFEEDPSVRYGMTTMCIGLGMGATVIWENPRHAEYTGYSGCRRQSAAETATTDRHHRDRRSRSMSAADFRKLADLFPDETVTHSYVQDIELPAAGGQPSPGTFALITLDNGLDHSKPTTLGPNTLVELGTVLEGLKERAARGEIVGVGVTGKPYFLVAGADLSAVKSLSNRDHGLWMAQLGHDVYATLANLGVPSFAFINGVALGGGLEIALQSTYRTVSTGAGALALPEAFIGLVPGWGGVYILPRLIGPENAVKVMIENPLSNNRTLTGPAGLRPRHGRRHVRTRRLRGAVPRLGCQGHRRATSPRSGPTPSTPPTRRLPAAGQAPSPPGRAFVEAKTSNASPAPAKVLDIMEANRTMTQAESAALECETLAGLMQTDEFRSTVYAFLDLVQKRSKRPAGAPDRKLARPVTKVGVVGAGLMASQLALLFARQLKVPVVMTDIDQARVDKGVGYVHAEVDKLLAKKRISPDAANRTRALVTGSVSKEAFADADFVIEAVFEELNVKKQVFAEVEAIVSPECILATNTSSLSVTAMAADLRAPRAAGGLPLLQPGGRDAAAGDRPRAQDRRRRAGHRV